MRAEPLLRSTFWGREKGIIIEWWWKRFLGGRTILLSRLYVPGFSGQWAEGQIAKQQHLSIFFSIGRFRRKEEARGIRAKKKGLKIPGFPCITRSQLSDSPWADFAYGRLTLAQRGLKTWVLKICTWIPFKRIEGRGCDRGFLAPRGTLVSECYFCYQLRG